MCVPKVSDRFEMSVLNLETVFDIMITSTPVKRGTGRNVKVQLQISCTDCTFVHVSGSMALGMVYMFYWLKPRGSA